MGSIKFWIMLWRLEAKNGERTNGKLALYFYVSAFKEDPHTWPISLAFLSGVWCPSSPHVLAKVEKDEGFASLIDGSKVAYAMALRAFWDSWNWKKGSNKTTWHSKIKLLTTYHEIEMMHGQ